MHRESFLFVSSLLLTFVGAACAGGGDSPANAEGALIGGHPAVPSELPSTLLVQNDCTAAKVGPRHILLAAHCVTSKGDGAKFQPGEALEITNSGATGSFASEAGDGFRTFRIDHVSIEPGWVANCDEDCSTTTVSGRLPSAADAALVVLRDELTGIPEASIDLSPVEPGEPVIVTGYGCEDAVGGNWDYSHQRLRVAQTNVLPFDATIHPGSFIVPADRASGLAAQMSELYAITPGPAIRGDGGVEAGVGNDTALGGLCPGDSGGPLYRASAGGDLVIVGINSMATFALGTSLLDDAGNLRPLGSPVTNWHTRVDAAHGRRVGDWLASQGANTTCTKGGCALPAPLVVRPGLYGSLALAVHNGIVTGSFHEGACEFTVAGPIPSANPIALRLLTPNANKAAQLEVLSDTTVNFRTSDLPGECFDVLDPGELAALNGGGFPMVRVADISSTVMAFRTIQATKAFFRDAPGSAPRNAFVLRGQTVRQLSDDSGGFVNATFTSAQGRVTQGFLATSDLTPFGF
jgi:hypothetical protein